MIGRTMANDRDQTQTSLRSDWLERQMEQAHNPTDPLYVDMNSVQKSSIARFRKPSTYVGTRARTNPEESRYDDGQ